MKLILRRVVELQYLGDDRLRALIGSGSVETEQPRGAVLEIARQLTPRIREAQDRIDEERELPEALADEIMRAGYSGCSCLDRSVGVSSPSRATSVSSKRSPQQTEARAGA